MRIGIFTDSHYSSAEITCGKRYNSRSLEKIREAVDFFEREKCDLVVCLGDLIDCEADHEVAVQNLSDIARVFERTQIRVLSLMGNHDAVEFSREEFYEILGENCRPENLEFEGKMLIFLDACFSCDGEPYSPEATHFDWRDTFLPETEHLKHQIEAAAGDVYLFIHQNIDAEVREDHRVHNAQQVRSILEESGKVKAVYQGHYHPGHTSKCSGIEYITFPAMCEQEKARFVLKF